MPVEERMLEQQLGRIAQERPRFNAVFREAAAGLQRVADSGRRLGGSETLLRQCREKVGDLIDETMTELPELAGRHVQRCRSCLRRACFGFGIHRSPSNKSDSRCRPPFTRLNTR